MQLVVSIQDIGFFLLFAVAILLGIYLIITIINANKILKHVKKLIEENETPISETIACLPEIAEETKGISRNIKKGTDEINEKVPGIVDNIDETGKHIKEASKRINTTVHIVGDSIGETAVTVKDSTENISMYIGIFKEVVYLIKGLISKKE